jgi:peptide-methionine (R)-S-oxide reductase
VRVSPPRVRSPPFCPVRVPARVHPAAARTRLREPPERGRDRQHGGERATSLPTDGEGVGAAAEREVGEDAVATPGEEADFDLKPWDESRVEAALEGLSPLAVEVTQQQATERAWTSELNGNKAKGTYVCAVCGLPLYRSTTKFDSGTGWPSFYAPFAEAHVGTEHDPSYGWNRTEVHCARCRAHLGHVFDDGPEPTGKRHCINGVSLRFVPEGEPLKR